MVALAAATMTAACGGAAQDDGVVSSPGDEPAGAGGTPVAAGCPESVELPSGTDVRGTVAASGSTLALDGGDQFFDPTCVTGLPAGTAEVTVTNVGESLHNIRIEDQDIDTDVAVGETVTVEVEIPESGVVPFVCKYHTTLGMNGALVAGG